MTEQTPEYEPLTPVETEQQLRRIYNEMSTAREARVRVNGAAWLLGCCRIHHAYVTSPFGERRQIAEAMGWLLREHQDAARVPVRTRHHRDPVWLDNAGKWHTYEEGAA